LCQINYREVKEGIRCFGKGRKTGSGHCIASLGEVSAQKGNAPEKEGEAEKTHAVGQKR